MDYSQNLCLFALLVLGIIAVPGMDMLFVTSNALVGGRRAGLAATGGILVGGIYHTLLGTIGTRLLLNLPSPIFTALQLIGAGYIGWIGLTLVRSAPVFTGADEALARPPHVAFRQGTITCILNPKAYIFVLSVYPQFLQPRFGAIWPQAVAMGAITATTQLIIYGAVAIFVAAGRERLLTQPSVATKAGQVGGAVFVLVAVLTTVHALA